MLFYADPITWIFGPTRPSIYIKALCDPYRICSNKRRRAYSKFRILSVALIQKCVLLNYDFPRNAFSDIADTILCVHNNNYIFPLSKISSLIQSVALIHGKYEELEENGCGAYSRAVDINFFRIISEGGT